MQYQITLSSKARHREHLLTCLFLTCALFFVTVKGHNLTFSITSGILQTHAAVDLSTMTSQQIMERAIAKNLTTKQSAADIVQAIEFDRVFAFLSTDELLNALRREGLVVGGSSNSSIISQMQTKGISVSTLRPDGIITAMATLPGGPLLVQKSGRQLWHIANDAKNTLKQSYEHDRFTFLNILTPLRLLKLLDDRIQPSSPQRKSWIAFSTQKPPADAASLIQKGYLYDGKTVQQIKAMTDVQPVGKRMLQINNYQLNLGTWNEGINPPLLEADGSVAKDTKGNPLYTLWLDDWETAMKAKTQDFFTQYKNAGGQLDTVSIDIEVDWLSMYFARNIWFAGKQNLIFNDPRWPALEQEMRQAGITDFTNLQDWFVRKDYRAVIWDSVMERRQVAAYNRAIFEPIRALYPNIKFTNYEYYNRSQTVPYGDYDKYPRVEYTIGTIQGTHQSMNLYDDLLPTTTKDGVIDQQSDTTNPSSFERFIEDVKGMRTMAASSTVPIMPWIAHPNFEQQYKGFSDHPYYAEAIFHEGLNGVDQFLLWVWSKLGSKISQDQWDAGMRTVDASLKELSDVAGYEGGKTLSFTQVDYQDDYVLTGYEVANKRVWRLTPRPGASVSTVSQSNPVVFTINGKRIEFAAISSITSHNPTVSTLGYWITETQGKTFLTQPAEDVYALLQQESSSSSSSQISSSVSSTPSSASSASSNSSHSVSSAASSHASAASSTTSSLSAASSVSSHVSSAAQVASSAQAQNETAASSANSFQEGAYSPVLVSDEERTLTESEAERLARADRRIVDTMLHGVAPNALPLHNTSASAMSATSQASSSVQSIANAPEPAKQKKTPTLTQEKNDASISWADFPWLHKIYLWVVGVVKTVGGWIAKGWNALVK